MAKPRVRPLTESTSQPLTFVGEGNSESKLVFIIAEASSKPAQDLLHKMIEAMGLKKDDVLIAHLENSPQALKLENLQPSVIVALGESIAQNLLATNAPISELRGVFRPFQKAKLIATFHPEDMIKKPELKKTVWADLQNVAKELGIAIPQRK
jgi:hypothetical protein